jgi:hypothetical protein
MRASIRAAERDGEGVLRFRDLEKSRTVLAGKEAPTYENVEPGGCVAPRDVDAFADALLRTPLDRDSMRRVLRTKTENTRNEPRPDLSEPDETNTRDAHTTSEFRTKRRRKH